MKSKINLVIFIAVILSSCNSEKVRVHSDFGEGWQFILSKDSAAVTVPVAGEPGWKAVNLPHDWSIEGEFSASNPATPNGGALPGGLGWYRKTFNLPATDSGRIIFIDFDGVYRNSEVWINGHFLGKRPYGYSSFRYDLTPYLHFGEYSNEMIVRVDNSAQPNSRWYSGSGIYRNVWLVKTGKVYVDHWGTQVTASEITDKSALIRVNTTIHNSGTDIAEGILDTKILDREGNPVIKQKTAFKIPGNESKLVTQEFSMTGPKLWTLEDPYLYNATSIIISGKKKSDEYCTAFGIRTIEFNRDSGFILNGKPVKILGVCNHHDLGALGAAINKRALERQLELLKSMGCNGIRTSHNPPAPELLDLCDKMGFVVMDEAFDMWKKAKTRYDYHLDWDEWHKKDIQDMVLRDRNHPSVVLWSIGNEIPEQWDSSGSSMARELAGYVRELDMTRPITSGCNETKKSNYIIKSGALDVIGFNYYLMDYPDFKTNFPTGSLIGSETTSAIATRGYYEMKSDSIRRWPDRWDAPFEGNPEHTVSSYDNCSVPWGSTHEEAWRVIKKYEFISGMFIWTGFDYLGEPTPYGWPSRSSYFGILDLAGIPKDAFYMYQSEWTSKPVLHLFPHWNWTEGDSIDMWVYTNCREVELIVNGASLGTKIKGPDDFHLQWRVKFSPGEVKAIGHSEGREDLTAEVKTAGKPAKIELVPDRSELIADGRDLSFIKVRILDENGTLVPHADNLVKFTVSGEGSLEAVDNGDQTSTDSFKSNSRNAFNGICLAIVKTSKNKGNIEFRADSEGLAGTSVVLNAR